MTDLSITKVFLSAFTVEGPTREHPKGRLIPCQDVLPPNMLEDRLQQYRYDSLGAHYEENHLEEWIARCPDAILPGASVEVIGSQNHAYMQEKLDLLILERQQHFIVVEVKAECVGAAGKVSPYQLYNEQLKRYVEFVRELVIKYPKSHSTYYHRFSKRFFGRQRDPPSLAAGVSLDHIEVREMVLAEGYDPKAVAYFAERAAEDKRKVQLVEYRFYPNYPRIDFWKVSLADDEPALKDQRGETSMTELIPCNDANQVYLVGEGNDPNCVQSVHKILLTRGKSLNKYNMITGLRTQICGAKRYTQQQIDAEVEDTQKRGVRIPYKAKPETEVDWWIEYGKRMAAEKGLRVSEPNGPEPPDLQKVISAWPRLTSEQKRIILSVIGI